MKRQLMKILAVAMCVPVIMAYSVPAFADETESSSSESTTGATTEQTTESGTENIPYSEVTTMDNNEADETIPANARCQISGSGSERYANNVYYVKSGETVSFQVTIEENGVSTIFGEDGETFGKKTEGPYVVLRKADNEPVDFKTNELTFTSENCLAYIVAAYASDGSCLNEWTYEFSLMADESTYTSDGWSLDEDGVLTVNRATGVSRLECDSWYDSEWNRKGYAYYIKHAVFNEKYGPCVGCCNGEPNLEDVVISKGVGLISDYAFSSCPKLKSVTIPSTVWGIGNSTFKNSPNVTIYCTVGSAAESYAQEKGINYVSDHDWQSDYTIDKEATCTEDGSKSIHCNDCEETKNSETIPATGHNYTHYKKSGGYLYNGEEYDICETCGDIINKTVVPGYSTYYVKSFKVSKGKKSFTAKWKKQSKTKQKKFTGYQVRYSKYSSMASAKTTTASKSRKSRKVSGLSAKTTYYVQVRSYYKYKGTYFYSSWSSKKSVKTK